MKAETSNNSLETIQGQLVTCLPTFYSPHQGREKGLRRRLFSSGAFSTGERAERSSDCVVVIVQTKHGEARDSAKQRKEC